MKEYTRIKHTVLMDIFARGLLSKREIQIASVIIRESWGWDKGKSNWTKRALPNEYFVTKTGIHKAHISLLLNQMILEGKILIRDRQFYSFNEHFDQWKKLPKRQLSSPKKVTKKVTPSYQKGNWKLLKGQLSVTKTVTFDGLEINITTINMKDLRARLKLPKESIKEIFKEIFKESTTSLSFFYKEKINPKGLKTFSDTRKKMVENRLENFSLNELKQVVTNISNSDWNMGRDPKTNGKKYCDFELLFRSDAKVEQYLSMESVKKATWRDKKGD